MAYKYDIFISYRRHREWTTWTREHVYNLLEAYLTQELGRPPHIFIDERIEPGADWPARLGAALGRSRILLPVFSRDYFGSDWCLHELDLMHQRLRLFPDKRLIIPLIGHDGEMIPREIASLQPYDLKEFRNTDLQRKTPRFERFADVIDKLAPFVAEAINSVPPFDPTWSALSLDRFDQIYRAHCDGSRVPVQTLTLKDQPNPLIPPRVTI